MGLTDKLMQLIDGARKLHRSRDPDSYARYERDRDFERERADRERQAREDLDEGAHGKEQRTHDFETRYAVEHDQHVGGERAKRPDSA
jgi:hypothetical protein